MLPGMLMLPQLPAPNSSAPAPGSGLPAAAQDRSSAAAATKPRVVGDWECPSCGDSHFAQSVVCQRCNTPRPERERSAQAAGSILPDSGQQELERGKEHRKRKIDAEVAETDSKEPVGGGKRQEKISATAYVGKLRENTCDAVDDRKGTSTGAPDTSSELAVLDDVFSAIAKEMKPLKEPDNSAPTKVVAVTSEPSKASNSPSEGHSARQNLDEKHAEESAVKQERDMKTIEERRAWLADIWNSYTPECGRFT